MEFPHSPLKRREELDRANKYYFNIAPNKLGEIIGDGEGSLLPCVRPGNGERDSEGIKEPLNLKDNSRFSPRTGRRSAPTPTLAKKCPQLRKS